MNERAKVGGLSVEGWEDLDTFHFNELFMFGEITELDVGYSKNGFVINGFLFGRLG